MEQDSKNKITILLAFVLLLIFGFLNFGDRGNTGAKGVDISVHKLQEEIVIEVTAPEAYNDFVDIWVHSENESLLFVDARPRTLVERLSRRDAHFYLLNIEARQTLVVAPISTVGGEHGISVNYTWKGQNFPITKNATIYQQRVAYINITLSR